MATKLHRFEVTDENGDDHVLDLPVKFEVCPDCEGRGTHVDPAIDGNGLTAEDFAEDPDFREEYFAGRYDVRCETCRGERVIPVVDREKTAPEELAFFDACERAMDDAAQVRYESYLERMAERRMGA